MLKNEEVSIGDHCWAISQEMLLIVLKVADGSYEVCGPWECGIREDWLQIISVIPRPAHFETTKLYYEPEA